MLVVPDFLVANSSRKSLQSNNTNIFKYASHKAIAPYKVLLNQHLILFVEAGVKTIGLADKNVVVGQGQGIFVPMGSYIMQEALPEQGEYRSFMIFLSDDFLSRVLSSTFVSNGKTCCDVSRPDQMQSFCLFNQNKFINTALTSLVAYFENPKDVQPNYLDSKVLELINYLIDNSNNKLLYVISRYAAKNDDLLLKLFMHNNLLNDWNVSDYAKRYGLSLSTFKKRFGEIFNQTPHNWLQEQRLSLARKELRSTTTSITDISYKLGFSTPENFATLFKKKFGHTPSESRMELRGVED